MEHLNLFSRFLKCFILVKINDSFKKLMIELLKS